jgi:hypothetical protein
MACREVLSDGHQHHPHMDEYITYASSDGEECAGRGWSVVVWARHGVWDLCECHGVRAGDTLPPRHQAVGSEQTPGHVCACHCPVLACVMYASSDGEGSAGRGWGVVVWARHGVWALCECHGVSLRAGDTPPPRHQAVGSEQTPGHVCACHCPVHACVMYASSDGEGSV